ncbi:Glucokinase [Sphingomonas paucimobilis]|nr:Glucokinase [Sphingomonas paucimobilis]
MEIVAVDIGGTHARFAIAEVENGRVVKLGEPCTQKTAEHASLQTAWQAFEAHVGRPLPKAASLAIASPITGDVIRMTNNPWVIRPSLIPSGWARTSIRSSTISAGRPCGRAGAAGGLPTHLRPRGADARARRRHRLRPRHGPGRRAGAHDAQPLSRHRDRGRAYGLCPLDGIEDAILKRLRRTYTRVSCERICSGPGIVAIYETLASLEGRAVPSRDDREIWTEALEGTDSIALAALDRFCLALGAVAGDFALAQGAKTVVIAGGLGFRIKDKLLRSGFDQRFVAKGRFQSLMARIPVKLITHPQPGLFGAAAAFAQEHT